MRYDKDFDIDIESRWWSLMSYALEHKKLCISLEKHINTNNQIVLLVKITPIDRKPINLFSEFDLDFKTELFYKAENFIKNYEVQP